MSLEAVKFIAQAEQSAESIIADAKAKAKTMITQAYQQVDIDYDESVKANATELATQLEKAQGEAGSISEKDRQKALEECQLIRDKAQENMNSAISIVVEKVVNG